MYIRDVCITAFWREKISFHSNSLVNMADNVNDKGDSRTIQQILKAVVAILNFIKGEALRFLRTNYSQFTFEENMSNFKTRLQNRDYSARIVEKHLSEIKFSDKEMSLAQKILPFVTQYHLTLPNLKDTLMGKWHLIENQPQLREIFKKPPSSHIVRENP